MNFIEMIIENYRYSVDTNTYADSGKNMQKPWLWKSFRTNTEYGRWWCLTVAIKRETLMKVKVQIWLNMKSR